MSSVFAALDHPADSGFTMKGWDFTADDVRRAIAEHRLLNPAMELASNACPWNCDFCFTESPDNPVGHKHRLDRELSLDQRLQLIDDAAALGARSINLVGAGEPTIDPTFWPLMRRMQERGITPIVYTEGSLRLGARAFCERLYDAGATVVLKVNSLFNADYQNRVVQGLRPKAGIPTGSYFERRQDALNMLMEVGFNRSVPTRLAFDTIICRENLDEIEDVHRFARRHNIFVLFVNYLPSGRTRDGHTTEISLDQQFAIFRRLAAIDQQEFGITRGWSFPYAGGVPCTIRGLGLFVKIRGEVFDCPGESMCLGDVRTDSLQTLWQRARPITAAFDGRCQPREEFWNGHKIVALQLVAGK
jgi:MoaA/NifB/PqqE/SkfB family radical SAM enzyme